MPSESTGFCPNPRTAPVLTVALPGGTVPADLDHVVVDLSQNGGLKPAFQSRASHGGIVVLILPFERHVGVVEPQVEARAVMGQAFVCRRMKSRLVWTPRQRRPPPFLGFPSPSSDVYFPCGASRVPPFQDSSARRLEMDSTRRIPVAFSIVLEFHRGYPDFRPLPLLHSSAR